MTAERLHTRLGALAWQATGDGPPLVFFAGAFANHSLWRDVIGALADRYRCITVDLPLGAHPWPLTTGADRSATSLALLLPECLELLELDDATVVANDTAGGLLLLALAGAHPGLARIDRLVLTNCDSYEHFPPGVFRTMAAVCRTAPCAARGALGLLARSGVLQRQAVTTAAREPFDAERAESVFGPIRRDDRIAGDLVAAMAGFRPQLLVDAAPAIRAFRHPVLLVWGEQCDFFPVAHARRLADDFPDATLITVPGAKTWTPVDAPVAVADAIAGFVPAPGSVVWNAR
jgi:pimeloyl-ACP methyl ester carboxylesterase